MEMGSEKKVFLGGTCNGSRWRELFKPMLKISYFDPVVNEWDETAYQWELQERKKADFLLYVITPKMAGTYSIAEVVDDSNKRPEKTLFCLLDNDEESRFSEVQLKSLVGVGRMVESNGGKTFDSLAQAARYINAAA